MLLYNLKLLALPYFIFLQLNTKPTPTVVELFTSEGCSSCPPADRLLTNAQSNFGNDIIVLSYHVDYWDRLGWKDPFSKAIFSERQRNYCEKLNPTSVYTPQAIVNGQVQFVGLKKNEVIIIELVLKKATVEVKRGENSGNTLSHTNIVQNILTKNTAKGNDSLIIPPNGTSENYLLVAFVQNIETLAINHAVQVALSPN